MNEKKNSADLSYSRRNFLKTTTMGLATIGGAVWLASLEACATDTSTNPIDASLTGQKVALTLANEPPLQNVGGFIRRTFSNNNGGKAALVIRVASSGTDAFKTMSTICTHAGCDVNNPGGGQLLCPCHGSVFSTQSGDFGRNITGPAPRPLQTFQTTFDGTTITVSF
jgi:Rieske Fe-S protein